MNEPTAREIALVRAIELADRDQQLLHAEDRRQANQAARELSHWQAAKEKNDAATAGRYLQARAHQLLDRLQPRHGAIAVARQAGHWPLWAGLGSALIALLAGGFAERIVNPQRVDLLSVALLAIVAWNLLVYLALLLWPLWNRQRRAQDAWLPVPKSLRQAVERRLTARATAAQPQQPLPDLLRTALLAFARDWARLAAPLTQARIARMLHLAAALFAAGAIASLYLRGIVSEYRVGWESTFLDATAVHGLLSVVFWPVVHLLGMQPFSVEQVAALQFGQPPQPASGARWVHLYAALLALVVVLPRSVLAALAWWRERQLEQAFPLDLDEPYFQRLLANAGGAAGRSRVGPGDAGALSVLPYSFRLNDARQQGLQAVAAQLLGDDARLLLRAPVGYGEDLPLPDAAVPPAALTLLLFNASATPEAENHGVFIDQVKAAAPRRTAALLDESGWVERFGAQPDAADRLAERRGLWRRFCQSHGLPVAFVDLLEPVLDGLEHDLLPRTSAMAAAA